VQVWRRSRTVAWKVSEEGVGKCKVGSRAVPRHILQERSVRNKKELDGDMEAAKI
jgi:ribosomal protein L35